MSNRPLLKPYYVIGSDGIQGNPVSGDMSANITSKVTILTGESMFSYQINWNGSSPVGNIVLQASNDYKQDAQGNVLNPGTWNTLGLSGPTSVSGNTGQGFIDVLQCSAYAVRLQYQFTSGTGQMVAIIKAGVA